MKRKNILGIVVAAVVIVLSVVLISRYLTKRTPTLLQGTVECTTYKASSKVPGRIESMKVSEGDRVEKGQLLYTLSTPELDAKLQQAEAVKSAAAALDAAAVAGARVQQIEAALNMWQKAQAVAKGCKDDQMRDRMKKMLQARIDDIKAGRRAEQTFPEGRQPKQTPVEMLENTIKQLNGEATPALPVTPVKG